MTGDFNGYLHRYQGRAVSVVTWDHVRMLGILSEVTHDSILMTGVLVRDSHENDSWSQHMAVEEVLENRGDLWPEMVIQRNLISTVTLVDPRGVVEPPSTQSLRVEMSNIFGPDEAPDEPPTSPEDEHASFESDAVCVELGVGLVPVVNESPDKSKPLASQLRSLRLEMERQLGFALHAFRVRSSFDIPHNCFRLLVHGTEVFRAELYRDKMLAVLPDSRPELSFGIATKEPAFGLEARWIDLSERRAAESAGCTVVNPGSVVVTSVGEFLKPHAASLLTYEAVGSLVDHLRESHPQTVSELMSSPVSPRTLFEVLRHLVDQGVCIRHVRPILEAVARHVEHASSMDRLVASVRKDVALVLVSGLVTPDGYLPAIRVSQKMAAMIADDNGAATSLESPVKMLVRQAQAILKKEGLSKAALLVPNADRPVFSALCRPVLPDVTVLGTDECPSKLKVRFLGTIDVTETSVDEILQTTPYSEVADADSSSTSELAARRKPR